MSESTSSTSAPSSTRLAREVAADEAEAAGDHHAAAAVELAVVRLVGGHDGPCGDRGRRRSAAVLAADDEDEPQAQHVDARLEDAAEVEELRLAERAMEVVHRHFDDAEAGVLDLLHHLEADDAAASSRD